MNGILKKIAILFLALASLVAFSANSIQYTIYETENALSINSISKSAEGEEKITLSSYYSDGVVIQRDEPILISGFSETNGASVTVTLGDESKTVSVVNGQWVASLPAMEAEKNLTMTITSEELDFEKTVRGVDIGDVFVMSGQSNIAYLFGRMEGAEEYLALSRNFTNIKFFSQPTSREIYEDNIGHGAWYDATAKNLTKGDVSAIGYVMATVLSTNIGCDVSVGIVDASYAGSMIQPWIDEVTYKRMIDDSSHNYYSAELLEALRGYVKDFGIMPETKAQLKNYYTNSSAYAALTDEKVQKPQRCAASICYNALISPIEGIRCKAVVWYQGEGNLLGDDYNTYFDAVRSSFRNAFSDNELPFFVIQLAPYYNSNNYSLVSTRAAQFTATTYDKNCHVITTTYEGFAATEADLSSGQNDSESIIHPARKAPIGQRLGASVLKYIYGYDTQTLPAPISVTRNGAEITVKFDSELLLLFGNRVVGFEISSDGTNYYKAEGVIENDSVILSADEVKNPYYVRYGYGALTMELKNGRHIEISKVVEITDDGELVVITSEGENIVLYKGDIIRSYASGNITNSTSSPAPTFKLSVGFGSN